MLAQTQPIWKQEPQLMAWLVQLQNHPVNANQDIVSCAGFFTTSAELLRHCWHYERVVMAYDDARAA